MLSFREISYRFEEEVIFLSSYFILFQVIVSVSMT